MALIEVIQGAFIIIGVLLMLVAAVGVLRMPDLYLRMSAATKASTLGLGLIMIGAGLHFEALEVTARLLAIVLFVTLTSPVAAHVLTRAAYLSGVPLWEGTVKDEMRGRYDPATHCLRSDGASSEPAGAVENRG